MGWYRRSPWPHQACRLGLVHAAISRRRRRHLEIYMAGDSRGRLWIRLGRPAAGVPAAILRTRRFGQRAASDLLGPGARRNVSVLTTRRFQRAVDPPNRCYSYNRLGWENRNFLGGDTCPRQYRIEWAVYTTSRCARARLRVTSTFLSKCSA